MFIHFIKSGIVVYHLKAYSVKKLQAWKAGVEVGAGRAESAH